MHYLVTLIRKKKANDAEWRQYKSFTPYQERFGCRLNAPHAFAMNVDSG